jgi:hypothetical protein
MSNPNRLTPRAQEMFARVEKYLARGLSQKAFCNWPARWGSLNGYVSKLRPVLTKKSAHLQGKNQLRIKITNQMPAIEFSEKFSYLVCQVDCCFIRHNHVFDEVSHVNVIQKITLNSGRVS